MFQYFLTTNFFILYTMTNKKYYTNYKKIEYSQNLININEIFSATVSVILLRNFNLEPNC